MEWPILLCVFGPDGSSRRHFLIRLGGDLAEQRSELGLCKLKPTSADVATTAGEFVEPFSIVEQLRRQSAPSHSKSIERGVALRDEGLNRIHDWIIGAHPKPVNPVLPRLPPGAVVGDNPGMISTHRIEERMQALGLNPFSAAKKAGLGQDYVRDLLRGKVKDPSASKLRDLAAALECSVDYLQGTEDHTGKAEFSINALSSRIHLAKLTVDFEIKDGFHNAKWGHRPKSEEAFTVVSYSIKSAEWLEAVKSVQLGGQIPPGSYLHVVSPEKYFDGITDVIVLEESTENGELKSRSVAKLALSTRGVRLFPWIETFSWEELLSGQNKRRLKVTGLVLRGYQFFDSGSSEDEIPW